MVHGTHLEQINTQGLLLPNFKNPLYMSQFPCTSIVLRTTLRPMFLETTLRPVFLEKALRLMDQDLID